MNILALEPFYGGSHQAFIDGWIASSEHQFTLLTLPDSHWKWRMRHAAIALAEQIVQRHRAGERWDMLWAGDMLNLAELKGLLPSEPASLPTVLYFHENQLTYPVQEPRERDLHFGFTNFISCCAADAVWFNSQFHQREFLAAVGDMLTLMPDRQPLKQLADLPTRCSVQSPGIDVPVSKKTTRDGPLRIVWAARWEHDKNAVDLFEALAELELRGIDFRLAVIGESYAEQPAEFAVARERFAKQIDYWGYQESRAEYWKVLAWADAFVSTAQHEFFGLSVVEAIAAGCHPMLPRRLAYPELLNLDNQKDVAILAISPFFYDGTPLDLADNLERLSIVVHQSEQWSATTEIARNAVSRYIWSNRSAAMDRVAEQLVEAMTD